MTSCMSSVKPNRLEKKMSEELEQENNEVEENVEQTQDGELFPSKDEMLAAIAGEEIPEPEVPEVDEPQYTEVEQEAISKGWNPEGVEGKRHKTAEEYLDIAPVYDRLHASEKKIKDMEAGFEHMRKMQEAQLERAKEQARKELKDQMKEAASVGDTDAVEKIADQLLETNEKPVQPEPAVNQPPKEFTDFLDNNPWYDTTSESYDVEKTLYADDLGKAFAPLVAKGKPLSEVYEEIEKKVAAKFTPTNPKREKAAPVASSTPARKTEGKKTTIKDLNLSQEEYRIVRNMINAGQMTETEYVQDYIKAYG